VLLVPKGHLRLLAATSQLAATLSPPGVSDTANLLAPPWNAWDAAKAKLRQALGEGELMAILQSRSTGSRIPIKTERWRTDDGYEALRSGGRMDDGDVFLREDDFARWLAGELPAVAAESSVPPAESEPEASADPPEPAIADGVVETAESSNTVAVQLRMPSDADLDSCIKASAAGSKDGKTSGRQLRTDAPTWLAKNQFRPVTQVDMESRLNDNPTLRRGTGKRRG
jgi:hypothetical protein